MKMWKIIIQEESIGRMKIDVECKALRFFPLETAQGTVFKALAFPILQIIVENEQGHRFKLKCNASRGVNFPEFTLQHPDTEEHPTIFVGEGKRRREIPDQFAPKIKKPGEKEKYGTVEAFKNRIKFLGAAMVEEVIRLFAFKLAEVEGKRMKKQKKKAA